MQKIINFVQEIIRHMISKAKIKLIHSLEIRKYRRESGLFVAEGHKLVNEMLASWKPTYIASLPQWIDKNNESIKGCEYDIVTEEELSKASLLKTPQSVLALFHIPEESLNISRLNNKLTIALDNVQDPGNLGTICRIADWFGIEDILCSKETADVYNPKAMQATMGALARIRVHYIDLPEVLKQVHVPIYGTFLDGEDFYSKELGQNGIIVMGNEGNGISPQVKELVNEKLFIPNYPAGRPTTDSLNVAIATSIICAEFRRRS